MTEESNGTELNTDQEIQDDIEDGDYENEGEEGVEGNDDYEEPDGNEEYGEDEEYYEGGKEEIEQLENVEEKKAPDNKRDKHEGIKKETVKTESGNDEKKNVEVADPNFKVDEVLQSKIKLSDDSECLIFSRGPRYPNFWPINCHLCAACHILSDSELKKHIESPGHQEKLNGVVDAETFRKPLIQPFCKPLNKLHNPIKIFPGETIEAITPDLYARLQKIEEFEFRKPTWRALLDILEDEPTHDYNENAPVLGLSYILKFRNPYSVIEYFCLLCMSKCEDIYNHVVESNHQMNYIKEHFPITYKKVKEGLGTVKPEALHDKYLRSIFRKLYRKFEELRGLRKIHIILFKDYKMGKAKRFNKFQFRKLVHYDETMIEIPEKEIEELIEKCKKGETIIEQDPVNLEHIKKSLREIDAPKQRKRRRPVPSPPYRRESPGRKYSREEQGRLDDTANNWDRYRRMLGAALDDLEKEYEEYEEIPEKHPDYESEWRRYWRRRSKELEKDNIDPSYYDFKPEWLDYWSDLLMELHKKDVAMCKFEIKRKLRLPYDKHSPSPIRRRRSVPPRRSRSRPRRRSSTPDSSYRDRRRYSRSPRGFERSRPRRSYGEGQSYVAPPPEPLGVLSVLRQLTILEEQLGSLGPKALDFLSRAVLFEKEHNKCADELMKEKEFYVFFMTAKEKLKGQLMANIIERSKLKTANNTVNDLETLLNNFEDYMRQFAGRNMFATNNIPPQYMGINMGNQMEDCHPPPQNVFDSSPYNRMNSGRNMPRQMEEPHPIPSQHTQYKPSNVSSNNLDDDEMLEAPPPPRNLFNVQKDETTNDNPIDNSGPSHRNLYNQQNESRSNARNMNPMVGADATRNQYGMPINELRDNRNMNQMESPFRDGSGGGGLMSGTLPQHMNQFASGKGGVWQSGTSQNFRSTFNPQPFGRGGMIRPGFCPTNPGGMGVMGNTAFRGRGGFRGMNPQGVGSFRGRGGFSN